MHIETVESPSENPDSLDPEPSDNTHLKETEHFSLVKFETGEVGLSILEKRWIELFNSIDKSILGSLVEETINSSSHLVSMPDKKTTLAIVATDNAHMQLLNKKFSNKPLPTNILSFQDGSIDQILNEIHLGDIFLGYEIINKEAVSQNIPLKNHMMHLIVHGALHLLGYDHEYECQAQIMQSKEVAILDRFNVPDPYLL